MIDILLIRKKLGLSQKALAQHLGVHYRTIQQWERGGVIPESKIAFIEKAIEELKKEHNNVHTETSDVTPVIDARHSRIPLVSQYAQAGYLTGYADEEYVAQLPTIDFTPDREMTGNYLAFEVRGDSMDDGSKQSYVEGEIVICREVEPYLYKECKLHIAKRDFVIVHREGILLKRIADHNIEQHTIRIHSLNPEYPDRTLDLSDVYKIFSVIESRMQRRR